MFEKIISLENLFEAWREFLKGKMNKVDIQKFSLKLADNIFSLHRELVKYTYNHGGYFSFNIFDPKPRNIHKASIRDRLLHHAIYRILYPYFDHKFIADSFSCRNKKGTHKALNRFRSFSYKASKNNTKTCWVLKGDVRKFFASINHEILINILKEYIPDKNIIWLLKKVIKSFLGDEGVGLPLGNLTSQLFANVYMNKFDQFMKHKIKVKYYIRYADDFVILSDDRDWLVSLIPKISIFLRNKLKLELPLDKIFIKTLSSGMDFLGWVNFCDHRVLRTATKNRMFKRIKENPVSKILNSYFGLLKHGNSHKLKMKIFDRFVSEKIRKCYD